MHYLTFVIFVNFIKLHKPIYFNDGKWERWKMKSTINVVFRPAAGTLDMETANGKAKLEQIANAAIASK